MRQRLRSQLTYANVMATLAVFLVLGGGTALVNMMYGEVSPGGTGSGLFAMLIFAGIIGVVMWFLVLPALTTYRPSLP
jgi:K+-transporting ATPase A subunit